MLRLLRHLGFLVSLAIIFGLARDAYAADQATAQALFDQGKKLMGEKKFAEACPKFEESQKLDPGLGTQTNLAICYDSLGKTASAWSLYLDVASQAKATNQPDREKKARDAAKNLEGKLSKLTIQVDSPVTGMEVKRNGTVVGQATWGTPIPVDPGEIKLSASAPGKKTWETTITIDKPGESSVKVPALEKGAPQQQQPPPGYYPGGQQPPPGYYPYGPPPVKPAGPKMKRRSTGMFVGGVIAIPVGGVALLAGAVSYAIDTSPSYSFYDGSYSPGGSGATGIALMVGGVILIGGGIPLIVIGNKKVPVEDEAQKAAPTTSLVPEVQLGLNSAQLTWQF